MVKKISIVTFITLICISLGCQSPDRGLSSQLPIRPMTTPYIKKPIGPNAGEIDIIEKVEQARQEYRLDLESLVAFYTKAGNNEKLNNATIELTALNTMPQFDYINPLDLSDRFSPSTQIMDADLLYQGAMLDKQQAEKYSLALVNKELYRTALSKFKQLIKNYNNSDKIDDAAYEIGEIDEYFKDYSTALEYFQAAYKWNPLATWPARFHAARILDRYMHNYAEALPLYREAIETEGKYDQNREWKRKAEERIAQLEKTVQ
jgi:tetratricopeptide (TPR) repeat protein